MARLNDLHDRMEKLKYTMTISLEKVAKGVRSLRARQPLVCRRFSSCRTLPLRCLAAAQAGRMAMMEAVIALYDDIPGEPPAECASYRNVTTELEDSMPARLVCVTVCVRVWAAVQLAPPTPTTRSLLCVCHVVCSDSQV